MNILETIKDIMSAIFFILIAAMPLILIAAVSYGLYYSIKIFLIKRLKYTRSFSERGVFEGDELVIIETIYNPTPLPLFFIDVESFIDNSLKLENKYEDENSAMQLIISRFNLMPFMQITRRHRVKCTRRGYFKMKSACVLTKNIIADNETFFDFDAELYVYPKIAEHVYAPHPVNFMQGGSVSARRVIYDPFLITGVRDYALKLYCNYQVRVATSAIRARLKR